MIVSWSIVNNEIDYIEEIINTHQWLDGMYFLDTGSTDGTYEVLQKYQSDKIIVEKYHQSFIPQYELTWDQMAEPFPEVDVRNFALKRVEELFNASWLVQLDGDEIFLEKTKDIINSVPLNFHVVGCSTINPVEKLDLHPIENRQGHKLYDPHARIWKPKLGIKYAKNPAFNGKQFHCIPVYNGKHLYNCGFIKFIPDMIHFHLHWMYGKKVELFFKQKGISNKSDILNTQLKNQLAHNVPDVFWGKRERWAAQ